MNLERALQDYMNHFSAVVDEAKVSRNDPRERRLALFTSDRMLLRLIVADAETDPTFANLVELTASELFGKEVSSQLYGLWANHVKTFLRISNLYLNVYSNQNIPDNLYKDYINAFTAEKHTVTHLALLDLYKFHTDELDCGRFKIKRFTKSELDDLLRTEVRETFYEYSTIDSEKLQHYWFLQVIEEVATPERGTFNIDMSGRVKAKYSGFPDAIQASLRLLALHDWHSHTRSGGQTGKYDNFRLPSGPQIPFAISVSSSPLEHPSHSPDLSQTPTSPIEETDDGSWFSLFIDSLNEKESMALSNSMRALTRVTNRLEKSSYWPYIVTALDFHSKAFTSDDHLDRLLWHITAIESVLGENVGRGLTALLNSRTAQVLNVSKTRLNRLYDFRSKLVHGDVRLQEKKIHVGHISEANDFSRGVIIWFLHLLEWILDHEANANNDHLSREDILKLLDIRDIRSVAPIAADLPPTFPLMTDWLSLMFEPDNTQTQS